VTARHDLRWKTIAADAETASLRAISCFNRLFSQGKAVLVFDLPQLPWSGSRIGLKMAN